VPEDLTLTRMGKIVKEKYPQLDEHDQEAVRQHAIAALNLTQEAKRLATGGDDGREIGKHGLIDGVRKFMNVRDLDIDLIDRSTPFGEAYSILAKTMSEESLKQVAAVIAAKKVKLTPKRHATLPEASREVQARARPTPIDHFAGRLGATHGRGRCIPCPYESGGREWLISRTRTTPSLLSSALK
jgi:hypothetical protein